jgi:hypothetical protein
VTGGGVISGGKVRELPYRGNSSLEQISDWLVKIFVGVGLIQLTSLKVPLQRLVSSVANGLGEGDDQARLMAASLIISGPIWGFLVAYVCTRRYLPLLLFESESMEGGKKIVKVASKSAFQRRVRDYFRWHA